MSSWSDDPRLFGFNPYIQQLPVEAMTSVGMERQRRYDEGIQRIQSAIDRVAGLDIVRDVDKQYLKSKLETLGGNLRTVAASDFSNYQLTNQVAGMASRIGKDNNVVNAVSSTAVYRKGINDMNAAIKEGKSSPSNEWDFKIKANKWLSSTNLEDTFNDTYLPYTDYKKHALEVIKGLTKDETITDDAFEINKDGKLVITDAVVRQRLAGISPEKVQQALMVGLTPADFKQMEIDGRYNYSNVDGEEFINSTAKDYNNRKNSLLDQRKILENAKTSVKSVEAKDQLDNKIAEIDKSIKRLTSEYDGIVKVYSSGDAEAAKARLHTINFMNGFSNAFSFLETSQTYLNSPFVDVEMERKKMEMDWKKFLMQYQQSDAHFWADHELRKRELELKEKGSSQGLGGLPAGVPSSEQPLITLEKVLKTIEEGESNIVTSKNELIKKFGKDEAWYNQQKDKWERSPSSVDPEIANHFLTTSDMNRTIESNKTLVNKLKNEAEKINGKVTDLIPTGYPYLVFTSPDGSTKNYTPEELVEFNYIIPKYYNFPSPSVPGTLPIFRDDEAKANMTVDQFKLYQAFKKDIMGQPLTDSERNAVNIVKDLNNKINIPGREIIAKNNNYVATELNKALTTSQGAYYSITLDNATKKTQFGGILLGVKDRLDKMGGMANSKVNKDLVEKIANNPEAAVMRVVEGTEFNPSLYEVTISGKDGVTQFRLTPDEKVSVFGTTFEATAPVRVIRPYQEQIRKTGGYSTAKDGGTNTPANSWLNNTDFPSIKYFGVKGNITRTVVTGDYNGDKYLIRLNIWDPIKQKWQEDIPFPKDLVTQEQLGVAVTSLSDEAIYQILYGKAPTAEDMKNIQKAIENNPF